MLTGQAKKDYQRKYMRKRRGSNLIGGAIVRPPAIMNYLAQRFRILQRDNFRCQYCGKTAQDDITLEIDHITPLCCGGTGDDTNLITACKPCNRSKGGRQLNYDAEQSITERVILPIEQPAKQFTGELSKQRQTSQKGFRG